MIKDNSACVFLMLRDCVRGSNRSILLHRKVTPYRFATICLKKVSYMSEEKGPTEISGVEQILTCTCMQSAYWPYCDSTHHTFGGTGPRLVKLDKNKTYHLCRCCKTKNPPFCDGSHNN